MDNIIFIFAIYGFTVTLFKLVIELMLFNDWFKKLIIKFHEDKAEEIRKKLNEEY